MAFYRPEAYLLPKTTQSAVSLDGRRLMMANNSHLGQIASHHIMGTP